METGSPVAGWDDISHKTKATACVLAVRKNHGQSIIPQDSTGWLERAVSARGEYRTTVSEEDPLVDV